MHRINSIEKLLKELQQEPRKPRKVLVAMSGGVDSSVAAYIMKEAGIEVIGVTLRLRSCSLEEGVKQKACCGAEDSIHAQAVAGRLGIPHYFLDYQEDFRKKVLEKAWEEYASGRTPNPCVLCNRFLKFGKLFHYAGAIGAEGIVTGHYARILPQEGGAYGLFRGIDSKKDQSYFLFALDPAVLSRCWFPLGGLLKTEVREIAREIGLSNAEKRESQDACFGVGGEAFADTLRRVLGKTVKPGIFTDASGKILGYHEGVHAYTLGQRRGLGVALGKRAYVARIDVEKGIVVLDTDEKELLHSELVAKEVNWLAPLFAKKPFEGFVQVRYTQQAVPAYIVPLEGGRIRVEFTEKVRAITPGQAAVVYKEDQLICGGWIEPYSV
ncbi:MAG: tRNA 2-thiouridine(34) synthase MnmA [Spirochaetales bacterium]